MITNSTHPSNFDPLPRYKPPLFVDGHPIFGLAAVRFQLFYLIQLEFDFFSFLFGIVYIYLSRNSMDHHQYSDKLFDFFSIDYYYLLFFRFLPIRLDS